MDTREAFQLFDWPRDGTNLVANVHLHDLIACHLSRVGYIYRDCCVTLRTRLIRRHAEVRVFESRVTQAVAKSEKRFFIAKEIAASSRWLVIVVIRNLTNIARYRYRKFAGRIVVTEQDIGDGGPRLLAKIPPLNNCGNLLGNVVDRKRTPANENNNGRLSCFDDGFDEIVLSSE
jgi:hypothetical protein